MSNNEIKTIASSMPGCPAWTVAVFKAEDVPEGTEVFPTAPVQAQEPVAETYAHTMSNGRGRPDDPAPFETVCVRLLRNDLPADLKLYAAPVQPVAVPDGDLPTDPIGCAGYLAGMAFGNCPADEIGHCVSIITAALPAPAAQGDAKDEVYEFAAKVIELFDDATMQANHMLDAGECASIIRALKSTEIAAIAAKAAS